MSKWKRSLGTSKREQGIVTPKAPQNKKKEVKVKREFPDSFYKPGHFGYDLLKGDSHV